MLSFCLFLLQERKITYSRQYMPLTLFVTSWKGGHDSVLSCPHISFGQIYTKFQKVYHQILKMYMLLLEFLLPQNRAIRSKTENLNNIEC